MTREKQTEEELLFQSALLANVSDSIFVYEFEGEDQGRLLYVNDTAAKQRGYTREELMKLHVRDLIAPEAANIYPTGLAALARKPEFTGESIHLRKDGTSFPVEIRLRLIEYGGRRVVINVTRDITVRKLIEQALGRALEEEQRVAGELIVQKAQLQAVIDNMDEAVAIWNAEGQLIQVNRATLRLFRFDSKEEMLQHVAAHADLVTRTMEGEIVPPTEHPVARALRGESFSNWLLEQSMPSNDVCYIGSNSGAPIRDASGKIVLAVVTVHDVTELYEARRVTERELETTRLLLEAARAVSQWIDLHDVGRELANILLSATAHTRAVVLMWDAPKEEFSVISSAGQDPLPVDSRWKLGDVSVALREVVRTRRRWIQDFDALDATQRGVTGERFHMGQVLYAPLVQRGSIVGVVTLDDPGEKRAFTKREIGIVEAVASQAAVAIENARLYEEQEKRAKRIEALHGVMEVSVSSLTTADAAQRILEFLLENGVIELGSVWIQHGRELELSGSVGYPPLYSESFSPMPVQSPMGPARVFRNGSIISPEPSTDPEVVQVYREMGIPRGGFVMLQLRSRDNIIGTLHFAWHEPRPIDDEDVAFYDSIAHEVGVVLENAKLYQAEHHIADRLQEALIALPDEIPGIEFAHAYRSATESARVGGDFYDLFELNDDCVGIVIGDVAGKGLDAAVLTSVVKNTVRAHANEPGKPPAEILELTNKILYKGTAPEMFVTVFFGILDRHSGELTYANAGHTTAVLTAGDGSVHALKVSGPVLGAVPHISIDQQTARLDEHGLLFLYTDGLTEARAEAGGGMYGEAKVLKMLSATLDRAAARVLRDVIADVMHFSGSRLRDDLAILAIKRVQAGVEPPQSQTLDCELGPAE